MRGEGAGGGQAGGGHQTTLSEGLEYFSVTVKRPGWSFWLFQAAYVPSVWAGALVAFYSPRACHGIAAWTQTLPLPLHPASLGTCPQGLGQGQSQASPCPLPGLSWTVGPALHALVQD